MEVRLIARLLNVALTAVGGTSTRGELARLVMKGIWLPVTRGEITDGINYLRNRGIVELKRGDSDWLDSHGTIVVQCKENPYGGC